MSPGAPLPVAGTDDVAHLRALLQSYRYAFADETELQLAVAKVLDAAGVPYERERPVSARDRLDFYIPASRVAIEIKVAGSVETATRQVERYLDLDDVEGAVLVASKAWARRGAGEPPAAFSATQPKPFAIGYLRRIL